MTAKSTPAKTDSLPSFDYQPRTRIVFGLNSVERVGELARGLGAKVVLVVTDPGIVTAGHADRVEHILHPPAIGEKKIAAFRRVHTAAAAQAHDGVDPRRFRHFKAFV